MFVIDCPNLIVVTDHKPLKGLHGYRDLSKIQNPRLFRLKKKTLKYKVTIQYCPGKWHRVSDAFSHNPITILQALINVFSAEPSLSDIIEYDNMDDWVKSTTLRATFGARGNRELISSDIIRMAGRSDSQYNKLIDTIQNGF